MKNTSLKEILAELGHDLTGESKNGYIAKLHLSSAAQAITQHFEACVPEEKVQPDKGIRYNDDALEGYNQAIQDTINNIKGGL